MAALTVGKQEVRNHENAGARTPMAVSLMVMAGRVPKRSGIS
jgi:hypothetical protein